MHVLVIEDESRLRDLLNRAVRDMGFEITCVGSAEAGLRILEGRTIDILMHRVSLWQLDQARRRQAAAAGPVVAAGPPAILAPPTCSSNWTTNQLRRPGRAR